MSGRDYAVLYLGSGKDRRSTAAGGNVLEPSGTPNLNTVLKKGPETGTIAIKGGAGSPLDLYAGAGDGGDAYLLLANGGGVEGVGGSVLLGAGSGDAGDPGGSVTISAGAGDGGADAAAAIDLGAGDGSGNAGLLGFLSAGSYGDDGQTPRANGAGRWVWADPTGGGGGSGAVAATEEFSAAGGSPETFTLADTPVGARRVYLDGARLPDSAVGGTGDSVEVDTVAGDTVTVDYEVAGAGGSGPALSDATPIIEAGAGDPGVSGDASRADHVHPEFGGGGTVELDYQEITSSVGITATSEGTAQTCIVSNSVSYDGSPVTVEVFSPSLTVPSGSTGRYIIVDLYLDSTMLGTIAWARTPASGFQMSVPMGSAKLQHTPSAGTHSWTVKAYVSGGSDGSLDAGAGGSGAFLPAFIRVTEAP